MADKTPTSANGEPAQGSEDSAESSFIDQSELDDLLAAFSEAGVEADTAAEPLADGVEPNPPADAGEADESGADEVLDEVLSAVQDDAPLDGKDIEEVLAPQQEDAADLDAPLGKGEPGDAAAGRDEVEALIQEAAGEAGAGSAPAVSAPDPLERLARQQAEEVVGSENLAAAAGAPAAGAPAAAAAKGQPDDEAQLSQEMLDSLLAGAEAGAQEAAGEGTGLEAEQAAGLTDEEIGAELADLGLDEGAEETPAAGGKREKVARAAPEGGPEGGGLGGMLQAIREHSAKLAVSLGVGLICTFATFALLYAHRTRPPDLTSLTPVPMSDLRRAIRSGRGQIDAGQYSAARAELDAALAGASPGPDRTEAEFVRLEAQYKGLPERLTLYNTEEMHIAIDDFLQQAPWHPGAPQALEWKAKLYERTGIPHAARELYNEIVSNYATAPNLERVLLDGADLALDMDRPAEAVRYLQQFLQQFPASPLAGQAKLGLGEALVAAGQVDEGKSLLRQIADSQASTRLGAEAYTRLGKVAFEAGRYDEAIAQLERRRETATTAEGQEQVYLLLAKAYRKANRPQEAERVLRELIDFFPDSEECAEAFVELTGVLDDLGMRREAERLASEAARRYPGNPEVLRNKGDWLGVAGNERAAAEAYLDAAQAGGDDPELLLSAARHLHRAGDLADARAAYERLVLGHPRSSQAFQGSMELAAVLSDQGKPREALRHLEDLALASEGRPQRLPVLIALGDMYQTLGFKQRAAEIFEQVAVVTTEPEVLAEAAVALFDAGAWSEGLAVAERVDVGRVRDGTAYDLLMKHGEALLRIDSTRGVEKMERAYEAYPGERTPEGDRALLKAYLATDRTARARILVHTIEAQVRQKPVDLPLLQKAAVLWGDYLFEQRDFRAAADAYALAASGASAPNADSQWAEFQRANAFLQMQDFEGSIALFDGIAAGKSPWADDAAAKSQYAKLEQRLRGTARPHPAPARAGG
ncbi:MAG: tetratricopeptide repeat protein [Candidatus Hydrogenedentes bacterium]|nr:tetratricopeptide repeat protein [Candidatus Hydrogenedentota bacterium]